MCRSTITSELSFKMQALAHCLFFFGCGYPNVPKQFIEMPNFSSLNCPCIFAPKNDIYEWVHSLDYLLCFKKMIYMSRSTLWIFFSVSLISSLFHVYVHPFHNTILSWLLYLYSIFKIKNASFLFCYSSKLFWLFMTFVSPTFILETIYMSKKSCWYFDWICINSRHNFVLNWHHYNVEPLNPWICYVFICVFLDFFWHIFPNILILSFVCWSPWGHKESNTTEWLNNNYTEM